MAAQATATEKLTGLLRAETTWSWAEDREKLLLAPSGASILGSSIRDVLQQSRHVLPLPAEYEALGQRLPMLSCLGTVSEDIWTVMPYPVLAMFEENIDLLQELLNPATDEAKAFAQQLLAAGPILLDCGDPSCASQRRWHKDTVYTIKVGELRESLQVCAPFQLRAVDLNSNDDLVWPKAWRTESKYHRGVLLQLSVSAAALQRWLNPKQPKRKRKPKPPAPPVGFTRSLLQTYLYDLHRAFSVGGLLRGLHRGDDYRVTNMWKTIRDLLEFCEELHGPYAYRRLHPFRESYAKLLGPILPNPLGSIRKAFYLCPELACWLERETLSPEADQIRRGTYRKQKPRGVQSRERSLRLLYEQYNYNQPESLSRYTPLCLYPPKLKAKALEREQEIGTTRKHRRRHKIAQQQAAVLAAVQAAEQAKQEADVAAQSDRVDVEEDVHLPAITADGPAGPDSESSAAEGDRAGAGLPAVG